MEDVSWFQTPRNLRSSARFSLYLKVGCVSKLAVQLDRDKIEARFG